MVVINNKLALEVLKSVYEHCKEIFGNKLHDAFLYGSYARGDYDTGSDIDILVTVDMDYKEIESLRSLLSIYTSRLSLKYDKQYLQQLNHMNSLKDTQKFCLTMLTS